MLVSGWRPRAVVLVLSSMLLVSCGRGSPISNPPASTSSSPRVVVTFQVVDQEFRIELTDPADIEVARRLLSGEDAPRIPNGIVVRGDPGANTGYSWHIDPTSVEFADVATEVCDGLPSDVEAGLITSDHYCPWQARVIAITG